MSTNGSPPAPPDYADLARQTAASNAAATQTQTVANRPNQTDAQGNTSNWTQDPATGQWTQKTQLSGANQTLLDQQNALQGTLTGQATSNLSNPLDTSSLQTVNDPNNMGAGLFSMDPTGNSQATQDATYKLLQPQRQQEREAEIQRMRNQGLTEDSAAFQRGMERLDTGDTNAQLKSLLAGQSEYGAAFGRGQSQNQQNFGQRTQANTLAQALRGSQLSEMLTKRGQPLSDLTKLQGSGPKPQFGQFMGAGNPGGTDFLGAGTNTYNAQMGGFNADAAGRANTIGGLGGLLGGLLGAPQGTAGNDFTKWFADLFREHT